MDGCASAAMWNHEMQHHGQAGRRLLRGSGWWLLGMEGENTGGVVWGLNGRWSEPLGERGEGGGGFTSRWSGVRPRCSTLLRCT